MGESSALLRGKGASRELLLATAAAYQGMYGNPDGTVPATFQVCHRGVSACTRVCVSSILTPVAWGAGCVHDRLGATRFTAETTGSRLSGTLVEGHERVLDTPHTYH